MYPAGAHARAFASMVWLVAGGACVTDGGPATATDAALDAHLPAWLAAPADVARDPALEEAAALLCARDTDAVLDDDARHAIHLADGQVSGLLRRAATAGEARTALAAAGAPLLANSRATHAGVVEGSTPDGAACAALVSVRRLIDVDAPAVSLPAGGTLTLALAVPADRLATLYLLRPDGFVDRRALPPAAQGGAGRATITVPSSAGEGRYVLEVIVDRASGPSDPEVALLWPYLVGAARDAPFPEVLFPDEGHDDLALTHRAEALVQRLRNEQLIEPFKVSPALVEVATSRARALAEHGRLGHRLPGGADAAQDVRARYADEPRAQFLRLAEVQAQASTLADAWRALLDSPAHRRELVDAAFTHCGVAVARGADAAGRPTITMVALLARRPPARAPDDVRALILERANEERGKRGLDPLLESAHLHRLGARLATAMSEAGRVDETLLGGPVGKLALESDATLSRVRPLVARLDDPLLLVEGKLPELLLDLDTAQLGVGLALHPTEGVFYVVLLAGE
ncbi:MAG: hypothetical protein HYS27_24520 [Deltaproteobacteria bacterium]|nr:hypothetical protein [Deltaproteobacteria bacterium]